MLLIRRSDNGNWSMAGGAHDPGESLSDTAIRETQEESGIDIELTGIVGIFRDPKQIIHYTSNDEVRQKFTIIYRARPVGGTATTSNESTRVEWVPTQEVAEVKMDASQRKRIDWALTNIEAYIDSSTR